MNQITFVTGSKVAACEKATSVSEAGSGLEATSAANVRLWTSRKACRESCHRSSTNLQLKYESFIMQQPSSCGHITLGNQITADPSIWLFDKVINFRQRLPKLQTPQYDYSIKQSISDDDFQSCIYILYK